MNRMSLIFCDLGAAYAFFSGKTFRTELFEESYRSLTSGSYYLVDISQLNGVLGLSKTFNPI